MTLAPASERRGRRGFTLVEVLLVLVILVIIGSIAVTAYIPMQRRANIDAARAQIKALKGPLSLYRLHMNDYPATEQGLEALLMAPQDYTGGSGWSGPYLDSRSAPLDPWGQPYRYEYPGRHGGEMPDVWSAGPDKISDSEDDIGSWQE